MAGKVVLNNDEKSLYNALCELVKQTKRFNANNLHDARQYDEQRERYTQMASIAQHLHQCLKEKGMEPRRHTYMYKNRRVPVYAIEFNDPLYPIEDLIAFINNPGGKSNSPR